MNMKTTLFLFFSLGCLISPQAYSQTVVTQVREGQVRFCQEFRDTTKSAFRVIDHRANLSSTTFAVSFAVESLRCRQTSPQKFAWVVAPFAQPIEYSKKDALGEYSVKVSYRNSEFVLVRDQQELLDEQQVPGELSQKTIQAQFPRQQILSAQEELRLSQGLSVQKIISLYGRSSVRIETSRDELIEQDRVGGGFYQMLVTINPSVNRSN